MPGVEDYLKFDTSVDGRFVVDVPIGKLTWEMTADGIRYFQWSMREAYSRTQDVFAQTTLMDVPVPLRAETGSECVISAELRPL